MAGQEAKKTLLKHTFPDLMEDLLDQLALLARVNTYPAEAVLCHEGKHENVFYIIVEGEVVFTKTMGSEEHLLRKGKPGDFFGEMALLDEAVARSASVKTSVSTTLLEIDRAVFTNMIKSHPELILSMTRIIVQRMRENDRQAMAEMQAQKQELQKAYDSLRKLDAQRNIFLTTLAHELRTPLTSVTGYMQLIRSGHMKGAGLQLSLEKIGAGLDRLVSLINDLLFLQEIEVVEPRFRKADIKLILEEVIEKAQPYAEQQKTIVHLQLPSTLPEMIVDTDGLTRAFGHLLDNAIKFSPDGGNILIQGKTEDAYLEIKFIDHGVGIDPEFMPRLFQRFERDETYGKHLFGGVGLGMPIVKHILDSHHGTIDVASQRGVGTTFILRLPYDAKKATIELNVDDAWVDVPG